MESED